VRHAGEPNIDSVPSHGEGATWCFMIGDTCQGRTNRIDTAFPDRCDVGGHLDQFACGEGSMPEQRDEWQGRGQRVGARDQQVMPPSEVRALVGQNGGDFSCGQVADEPFGGNDDTWPAARLKARG
jgi:hypothetical protein